MIQNEIIHVRISKATETVWEGEAYSLSAKNTDGAFDVLPMHANFITFLQNEPIVVESAKEGRKEFVFKTSVLYVRDNLVSVYTGINE